MSYELLVEVTRNNTVESRHFGSAVVSDYKGNIVESWGDIDGLVFPRSTLKPMLAIQLVESGACDEYALNDAELSLACSSHQGEPIHQKLNKLKEIYMIKLTFNTVEDEINKLADDFAVKY